MFKAIWFGLTSSPYLLPATINHHLHSQYPKNVYASSVKEALYIDNLQGTVASEHDLIALFHKTNQIFQETNMPLQEWGSNNKKLQPLVTLS